jgi:hypothetical protein
MPNLLPALPDWQQEARPEHGGTACSFPNRAELEEGASRRRRPEARQFSRRESGRSKPRPWLSRFVPGSRCLRKPGVGWAKCGEEGPCEEDCRRSVCSLSCC